MRKRSGAFWIDLYEKTTADLKRKAPTFQNQKKQQKTKIDEKMSKYAKRKFTKKTAKHEKPKTLEITKNQNLAKSSK